MSDEPSRWAVFNNTEDIRDGVRIVYDTDISRGAAWTHLWNNPPIVRFNGADYTPLFERLPDGPQGQARHRNPYRKYHDEQHWVWIVRDWRAAPAVRGRRRRHKPPPRKSRYELLLDDTWLGVEELE